MSPKLEGLKAGDRIRVTSEAEVVSVEGGELCAVIDGNKRKTTFSPAYVDAPTFSIEKLLRPLAEGDLVRRRDNQRGAIGEVVCFFIFKGRSYANVSFSDFAPSDAILVAHLERVTE